MLSRYIKSERDKTCLTHVRGSHFIWQGFKLAISITSEDEEVTNLADFILLGGVPVQGVFCRKKTTFVPDKWNHLLFRSSDFSRVTGANRCQKNSFFASKEWKYWGRDTKIARIKTGFRRTERRQCPENHAPLRDHWATTTKRRKTHDFIFISG